MANGKPSHNEITIIEARTTDIPSLTTIVPRSFHPVNPYIKQTIPDTPGVREWWSRLFADEINDSSCHVFIAINPATDKDVGVLTLRLLGPQDSGVGFWTTSDWADDFDHERCKAMVDSMVENRERLMMGRSHYLIELFGVDHEWKGAGVGTKLLANACETADRQGCDVFVQANGNARAFYEKLGFGCEAEVEMPGEAKYVECMMVRRHGES